MPETMTRDEALQLLLTADRLHAEALLPTLSPQERLDKLYDLWEDDVEPTITEQDDPADVALGIFRSEEEGFRLVRSEPPDDPNNPRYDKLILLVLPGGSGYYGATNRYLSDELARIGHPGVTVVGEPELLLPCPCCGHRTLARRGEYDICSVCRWEDDGATQANHFSGPNHMTLAEGRRNYLSIRGRELDSGEQTSEKYVCAVDYSRE